MFPPGETRLAYVHLGRFSGSAVSLLDALRAQVAVDAFDLTGLARQPALLPRRAMAVLEARRAGGGTPWSRTAAWSAGVQRWLAGHGVLAPGRPTLVVQTLPALVPGGGHRYGIYTDRVAREGAVTGGRFRSRFSPGWLAREEASLRGAHRVYVMGDSTRQVLEREYGLAPSRIRVVGAGPNARLGPPVRSTACRRLLFVGTQWELKGGPELLAAFAEVRRHHPDLELMLAGSGPPPPLPPGVISAGRVPHAEMDALYSQVDAVVIPTHVEAFGIALLEALMKGLPCIHTAVGNQPWLVGGAGECVEPGDVAQLAAAIRRVVTGYPAYAERARARRAELAETCRWDRVAATIVGDLVGPGGDG